MVVEGVTVIEFPVPIKVVPHPPVYQYTVPIAPLAVKVVDVPLQIVFCVAVIDVGADGGGV